MIVMVCVDNRNGMMFNHRRQSQDRGLRRRMCEIAGNDDGKFWMNAYSRKMFTDSDTEGTHAQLCVAEDFMKHRGISACWRQKIRPITQQTSKN